MCPCRGRRRGRRWISELPQVRCFLPDGCPRTEAVCLTLEELEAVRLVDLLELEQEEAASYMGISRKALWNDLSSARKKISTALVYGMGILIEGGSYILREKADTATTEEPSSQAAGEVEMALMERELHLLGTRLDYLIAKMNSLKGAAGDVKIETAEEGLNRADKA
jgi:predicted DNA-binding protein (UPF0251 family)